MKYKVTDTNNFMSFFVESDKVLDLQQAKIEAILNHLSIMVTEVEEWEEDCRVYPRVMEDAHYHDWQYVYINDTPVLCLYLMEINRDCRKLCLVKKSVIKDAFDIMTFHIISNSEINLVDFNNVSSEDFEENLDMESEFFDILTSDIRLKYDERLSDYVAPSFNKLDEALSYKVKA